MFQKGADTLTISEFDNLSREEKYLYMEAISADLRNIMIKRFIIGESWHKIAMSIGKGTSVDSIRSAVKRYLKKF